MLRKSEQIKIDGQDKELTVNELTVNELDKAIGSLDSSRKPYWAEVLFDLPIPVEVVTASTGMRQEDMGKLTPSELHEIWLAVARVNDFLSRGLARLGDIAEKMAKVRAESSSGESSAS